MNNDSDYSNLKSVKYLGEYKVHCVFEDGEEGTLDLVPYLSFGGVFDQLKDQDFASKPYVNYGVICWGDDDLDIAPETVYHEVTGKPLPDWMEA